MKFTLTDASTPLTKPNPSSGKIRAAAKQFPQKWSSTMRFKMEATSHRVDETCSGRHAVWDVNLPDGFCHNFLVVLENWSNTANPNGRWSYRQGSTYLPLVPDWTAAGTAFEDCDQPAWAPSNGLGDFLPAFMKVNACTVTSLGSDPNNNGPERDAGRYCRAHSRLAAMAILPWASPTSSSSLPAGDAGSYQISGSVWDASLYYGTSRPQDWVLLVNGIEKEKGFLSGNVSRQRSRVFRYRRGSFGRRHGGTGIVRRSGRGRGILCRRQRYDYYSGSADLFLRIIPTTTTVHQGDLLTYAFPVWNLGPDNADQEVLITQVPPGTTFDYIRISGTPGLGDLHASALRGNWANHL